MTTPHGRLLTVAYLALCAEPTPGGPCMRRQGHPNGHLPVPARRARSANDPIEVTP